MRHDQVHIEPCAVPRRPNETWGEAVERLTDGNPRRQQQLAIYDHDLREFGDPQFAAENALFAFALVQKRRRRK